MKLIKAKILSCLLTNLKNPPSWTEEEKKIMAWSICWEGCICLTKRIDDNPQKFQILPYIGIANTNFNLLQKFQDILRLGSIEEHKTHYRTALRRLEECLYFLLNIYEFLPAKREQAFYTIQYIQSRLSHKKGNYLQHFYTPSEVECQKKVHELNSKRGKRK